MRPKSFIFSIYMAAMVFAAAFVFGFVSAQLDPAMAEAQVAAALAEFDFARDFNDWQVLLFIFFNNAIKAGVFMGLGLLFGLAPLVFLLANGSIVGMLFGLAQIEEKLGLILLGIVPHGILEVPAIIIAMGYGVWWGWRVFAKLAFGHTLEGMVTYALRRFVRLVLPMLALAALIETFFTAKILEHFR